MKYLILLFICLSSTEITAEEIPGYTPLPPGFSGEAEFGASTSKGNVDSNSLNAALTLKYGTPKWEQTLKGSISEGEFGDVTTAERYTASYEADYQLTEKTYLFGFVNFEADKLINIDSRFYQVAGYGSPLLFRTKKHTLGSEIGLGLSQAKYTSGRAKENEAVAYLGLNYIGKITEKTTLNENFVIFAGTENTFSEFITSLNIPITKKISLKLNHTLRHNTKVVVVGVKKTDITTGVNLVIKF